MIYICRLLSFRLIKSFKSIFAVVILLVLHTNTTNAVIKFSEPDTVLHVSRVETIKFTSSSFNIAGKLYLPSNRKLSACPVVIWVSGSGPSYKEIKSAQTIKVVNCFLDAGFAYFRIDKPGCGESTGTISEDSTFNQLSNIVVDAVSILKENKLINKNLIGLFGSSQAGYIMPLAISKCREISFMIGSSCPGENSIDQWNYLIEKQMICEGYSEENARMNTDMFHIVRCTDEKFKFDIAIKYFSKNPFIIKAVNYDSTFSANLKNWWPREKHNKDESDFNPVDLVPQINIPVFMVYGEKDTQIDPVQAEEAYRKALSESSSKLYRIKSLKNTDHNMCLTDSGCLSEIRERNTSGTYQINPEFITLLKEWIKELFIFNGIHEFPGIPLLNNDE